MLNNTRVFLRKQDIRRCIQFCDNNREKINILVNLVYKQENEIAQLQREITYLLNIMQDTEAIVQEFNKEFKAEVHKKRISELCVQVPF